MDTRTDDTVLTALYDTVHVVPAPTRERNIAGLVADMGANGYQPERAARPLTIVVEIVDGEVDVIIRDGNHRLAAALALGWTAQYCDVVIARMTGETITEERYEGLVRIA